MATALLACRGPPSRGRPLGAVRQRGAWAPRGVRQCCCWAQAGARQLELHVGETTIAFPLRDGAARELSGAITTLLQTLASKQAAERPRRWPAMEFKLEGDPAQRELEYLEFFCNPNACSSAFDAKVLVTLRTGGGVHVTTEGRLSALKSDVDAFTDQLAPA